MQIFQMSQFRFPSPYLDNLDYRGTQHITGTVSNEATSDMGYWI